MPYIKRAQPSFIKHVQTWNDTGEGRDDTGGRHGLIKLAAEIYRLVRMSFSQSLLSMSIWEQRDAEEST